MDREARSAAVHDREVVLPRLIKVPDVLGLPMRKARLLLEQAGLVVESVLYRESYEERDTVLEQRPRRGEMIEHGRSGTLVVSRESYLRWLPAIYQRSEPTGRNMVRDVLWIVQHLFGSIEEQLDGIHNIFDPYETRQEFLPWLASWSAMVLEPDWDVEKRRRLIKKAMELYAMRGTVRGLQLFISLFTGFEPRLEENMWPFQGCRVGVTSAIGIDTVILPQVDKANAFVVVMPHEFSQVSPAAVIRLHEIIEMEKPANTTYMLKFAEPRPSSEEREFFQIGIRSGINIGEEIVTPLPISEETGEPDYPKDVTEPAPPPDPSVFDLFGTRKREMPRLTGVPKADDAPVEGREVQPENRGFAGPVEIDVEALMQELLRQQQGLTGEGQTGEVSLDLNLRTSQISSPAEGSAADTGGSTVDISVSAEGAVSSTVSSVSSTTSSVSSTVNVVKSTASSVKSTADTAGPAHESGDTPVDPADPMKLAYGERRFGSGPKIEVEVEQQAIDDEEEHEVSDEALEKLKQDAKKPGKD